MDRLQWVAFTLTIDIPTSIKSVLGGAMYCDFLSFDLRTLDRGEDKSDFTQKEDNKIFASLA